MKAVLGLEDGRFFIGKGFGVEGETCGELVFTTQMTGYMEALTDPSYLGQILMFTFPLIGNYGVDPNNFQNPRVRAEGCVVHELCDQPAHTPNIASFFEQEGLLGISGVDTRNITIQTREQGTLRAGLIVGSDDGDAAVNLAKHAPDITYQSLIPKVSCTKAYDLPGSGPKIAVIDLGIKKNIIRSLQARNANLRIFPHNARNDEISSWKPDALFNQQRAGGPGDG